ncbi:uncharacterized protein LOC141592012 [Silene latifolia]|uniref:uncharacterized protein LOC141592012 n=1 Tax=Silene latifolia TaxID=37657 RepID=UPI003D7878CB
MEDEKKRKGKQPMQKGKEKVKCGISVREPVERDEREESDESEDISEETETSDEKDGEASAEEEGSDDEVREDSGEEEKQVSESEDGGLADMLSKVVKMAAALGAKKMTKEDTSTVDEGLKVSAVGQSSKEVEVGQGSKRKLTDGALAGKKKRQRKERTKLKGVEGHGSPTSLHYVINHLSTAQRKDVEDIGFEGLLGLKASKFIHTMVDWLLERYDTHTRLMLFKRFVHFSICKHDVYDVFMLPCAGEDVPLVNEDKELVQSWRERFGALPKKDIPLDKVRGEMLQLVKGGSDFKRMFVLFTMGSFLAPTIHNRVDTRLIGAVEDVAAIPKMDWCSYVLDRLDHSVESWRDNDLKSIGGCLMFFQLLYFHRLTWRRLPALSTLPLIQHWTYDELKKRVKE